MSHANPEQPSDRRSIEDAIHAWVASRTGVGNDKCFWVQPDQDSIVSPSLPFATIAWLGASPTGKPWHSVVDLVGDDPPEPGVPDLEFRSSNFHRAQVSISVFCDPKSGSSTDAWTRLSAALHALGLPSVRRSLNRVEIGVLAHDGPRVINAGHVNADVTLHLSGFASERVLSIQRVHIEPSESLGNAFDAPHQQVSEEDEEI